jgi:hypothetical protein
MTVTRTAVPRALAGLFALLVVACGETPHVDEAATAALTESTVSLKQTGNAAVSVVPGSVRYRLDDARLLEVTLTAHSAATTAQTVTIRASLFDKSGRNIGDATGGQLDVGPGSDAAVTLSGPQPNGTIAAATFEITTIPAPTPLRG